MATVNLFSGTLIIIIQYSIYNYDKQIELHANCHHQS